MHMRSVPVVDCGLAAGTAAVAAAAAAFAADTADIGRTVAADTDSSAAAGVAHGPRTLASRAPPYRCPPSRRHSRPSTAQSRQDRSVHAVPGADVAAAAASAAVAGNASVVRVARDTVAAGAQVAVVGDEVQVLQAAQIAG